MGHARIGVCNFRQGALPPTRNDDFVTQSVKGFSESPADAGSTACDENSVVSDFHGRRLVLEFGLVKIGNQARARRMPVQVLPRLFA